MDRENEKVLLKQYLLECSNSANVEPVFTTDNGEEYTIDDESALKVLNDILEQAFIPFFVNMLYKGGVGYIKNFANELKFYCGDVKLTDIGENGTLWGKIDEFCNKWLDNELFKKHN